MTLGLFWWWPLINRCVRSVRHSRLCCLETRNSTIRLAVQSQMGGPEVGRGSSFRMRFGCRGEYDLHSAMPAKPGSRYRPLYGEHDKPISFTQLRRKVRGILHACDRYQFQGKRSPIHSSYQVQESPRYILGERLIQNRRPTDRILSSSDRS